MVRKWWCIMCIPDSAPEETADGDTCFDACEACSPWHLSHSSCLSLLMPITSVVYRSKPAAALVPSALLSKCSLILRCHKPFLGDPRAWQVLKVHSCNTVAWYASRDQPGPMCTASVVTWRVHIGPLRWSSLCLVASLHCPVLQAQLGEALAEAHPGTGSVTVRSCLCSAVGCLP